MRILIVDDSVLTTRIVAQMLNNNNIECVVKYNGKEAVDLLLIDNNFDIILMDIEMPVMNGIEATKKIKSFMDIPVFVITSYPEIILKKQKIACGFNEIITKPFDENKLITTIKEYINSVDYLNAV